MTTTTPGIGQPDDGAFARLSWSDRDAHRWVTWLAFLALAVAATLAVVGLPSWDMHGPLHKWGIMDPLCGGTRAARFAARGQIGEAWRYNPLSLVIVISAILLVVRSSAGLATRRWINIQLRWTARRRLWVIAVVVTLLALLEVRQQGRADLLSAGTQTWV